MDESALKLQSGEEDVLDVTEGSLSQWQLIRLRFRKHRLAVVSLYVLVVLYSMALFAEFFAPYTQSWKNLSYAYCPPTTPSFSLKHGFYTYALKLRVDPITLRKYYIEDRDDVFPLGFFVKGVPYKLFGLIPAERHFVDVDLSLPQLDRTGACRSRQDPGPSGGGLRPRGAVARSQSRAHYISPSASRIYEPYHRHADPQCAGNDIGRDCSQFPWTWPSATRGELGGDVAGLFESAGRCQLPVVAHARDYDYHDRALV